MISNRRFLSCSSYDLPAASEPSIIHLDIVENLFPIPRAVTEHVASSSSSSLHAYPTADNVARLEREIRAYLGLATPAIHLQCTQGSDQALRLVLDAMAPQSKIVALVPTYPHFLQMVSSTDHVLHTLPCASEEDLVRLIHAGSFHDANLVYIVSPNLPLGYELSMSILFLLNTYPTMMVVVDEAYAEFGRHSMVPHLAAHPNLLVTRTFSKFFGLAALRIGYIMTSCLQWAHAFRVLSNAKTLTTLAVTTATVALQRMDEYRMEHEKGFARVKEVLDEQLPRYVNEKGEIYSYTLAAGNFFLLYARNPAATCRAIQAWTSCAVRDKSAEVPDAIRVSIAPLPLMRRILLAIRLLNRATACAIAVDLDGTLRRDAKLTTAIAPCVRAFLAARRPVVVTNNVVHTPAEIRGQLGETTERSDDDTLEIWSPMNHLHSILPSNTWILPGSSSPPSDCAAICILHSVLDFGTTTWSHISQLVAAGKPVYCIETPDATPCSESSESPLSTDSCIPDVGTMLRAIGCANPIILGKPHLAPPHAIDVMIGNTDTDRAWADRIGADFVRVSHLAASITIRDEICGSVEKIMERLTE